MKKHLILLLFLIGFCNASYAQQVTKEYKIQHLISSDVLQKFQQINRTISVYDHKEGNHLILVGDSLQVKSALEQLEFLDIEQKMVAIEFMLVEYIHDESFRWEFDIETAQTGNFNNVGYAPGVAGFTFNAIDNLIPEFRFNLQALVNEGKAKVVTNPHLVVQSGESAQIDLRDVRYFQVQQAGLNGITIDYQKISAGINLEILPVATHDSIIHLDINGHISEFLPLSLTNNSNILTEESNQITTQVDVKDGQTLIIGGLIQEELIEVDGGFPGLRKVPILKWFFNKQNRLTVYVEKVIYITSYIQGIGENNSYSNIRELTPLEQETQDIIETDPDFTRYRDLKNSFRRQDRKSRRNSRQQNRNN